MLKSTPALASTVVVATWTVACAGAPAAPPAPSAPAARETTRVAPALAWQRWEDPAHRFVVDLPGQPVVKSSSTYVDYGYAKEQAYFVAFDNRTLGVIVTDYPEMMIKNAVGGQVFGAVRKQVTSEIDGTVSRDEAVSIPSPRDPATKLDGRRLVVESESMSMVSRNFWVLDGVTLYRIIDSSPAESGDAAAFERMVGSFTILATAAAPAPEAAPAKGRAKARKSK